MTEWGIHCKIRVVTSVLYIYLYMKALDNFKLGYHRTLFLVQIKIIFVNVCSIYFLKNFLILILTLAVAFLMRIFWRNFFCVTMGSMISATLVFWVPTISVTDPDPGTV